jgi:Darcynin, domain of unknown function
MNWVYFLHLKTLPAWLALSREDRQAIVEPAFAKAMPEGCGVTIRYFDADAFHANFTDVAMFEASDPKAYYFVIERLRETPLFSVPYFEITQIIQTLEEGYRTFVAEGM